MKEYGILEKDVTESSLECALNQIRRLGFAIVNSGLSESEVQKFQTIFDDVHDEYNSIYSDLSSIDENNTIRAPLLINEEFLKLSINKNVLQILNNIFGENVNLNQQNGIINPARKEYNQASWHRDLPYQHFTSSKPLGLNALYCVDDFTKENGATAVIPGTHLFESMPSDIYTNENKIQLEAKAGNFIICDAMLYHSGQYNSTNKSRRGVNHVYTIPIIKKQIDFSENDFAYDLKVKHPILGLDYKSCGSVKTYLDRLR
jgi:hypothetical protein